MNRQRRIIMLGTDPEGRGGIASVIRLYEQAGLLDRFAVRYLPTHCDGSSLRKAWFAVSALARYVLALAGRPTLVHVHVASRASFWRKAPFFLLAFLCRIPAILHLHGAEFELFYARECGPRQQAFVRYIFDRCACVIVLSSAWQHWARSISRNPRIVAVYNPVALPEPAPPWDRRQPGDILFLGRLGHRKGSYDLLEAASLLARRGRSFRLRLGGDGEVAEVRQRARELGIDDRVELLGWVRGSDKDHLLASAWLYVLPSYNEGLPVSVLEAMAAGLPVVTTPVGGIPEAVTDGAEGLLIAAGAVNELADGIERVLIDQELARTLGTAARAKVSALFSVEAVIPRIEAIYTDIGRR